MQIIAIAVLPQVGACSATGSGKEWGALGRSGALLYLAAHCGLLKCVVIGESCLPCEWTCLLWLEGEAPCVELV